VIPKGQRYKLVVGQRRLLAFQSLGRDTIPAIIVKPIGVRGQRIVSFGENIHRRKLPYDDTIKVCEELYKETTGSKFQRVQKIAESLGIHPRTVSQYLAYKLIPNEVQRLVTEGKLSAKRAYAVTSAFWPNKEKIIKIANYMTRLTKPELERALDIGRKKPDASPEEIVEEAKRSPPPPITISFDRESYRLLQEIANARKVEVVDLIKTVVDDFIKEEFAP